VAPRAELRARAERAGILSRYAPAGGGAPRETRDRTRRLLLAALGAQEPARPAPAARVRCASPRERLGRARGFGIWLNLYSLRGRGGLGVGTLSDLAEAVRLAGAAGAAFVGVSPLHALRNRGAEVSPYQPLSRLFRNPLYLDVEAVPEWRDAPAARRALETGAGARERAALRASPRVAYERVARLQRRALEAMHAGFRARHAGRDTPRGRAFARFVRAGGEALRDFACFCAIEDRLAARGGARDWRAWPAELRSPRSAAVARFRARHAAAVDYHLFVQFELDCQLAAVAAAGRRAGLAVGLYLDLALGSVASGFDGWAFPDLFVPGVSLGAPPDAYARVGQDWDVPPLHPRRVVADGGSFWRALLRANLAHAGALRIDHAMGLLRQWWIPRGEPAARGAYVRFPAAELLSALARESRRAGALVVGEDLGTVPRGLASLLARFGVLSSRVLLFERDARGAFRRARGYSRRAVATANTHDLATLSAWWEGDDLALRARLGLLRERDMPRVQREREAERRALVRRLCAEGDLRRGAGAPGFAELRAAVHAFLCHTPCPLVGLSLDDLAGEREPVNVPGVPLDRHPSWTRRMQRSLADLARDPLVARELEAAARIRG
jgi:4-alpha-glucanotransferase